MKQFRKCGSLLLSVALLCALTVPAFAGTGFINNIGGTFYNDSRATFNNQGAFDNQGTVTNNGTFSNGGTLLDNGAWSGTVPSGKTSGAAITNCSAYWNSSDDTLRIYPAAFGTAANFSTDAVQFEFEGLSAPKKSSYDSEHGNWRSPTISVTEIAEATKFTIRALDTSDQTGETLLNTVGSVEIPFEVQNSTQTVPVTATISAVEADCVKIDASFGSVLPQWCNLVITYSVSDATVAQVSRNYIVSYPNDSSEFAYSDYLYNRDNSDNSALFSAAKEGNLIVTASALYCDTATDSSTKKLTVTRTAYSGSTSVSAPTLHTVTFEPLNNEPVFTQTVLHGNSAEQPSTPTKSGYVFNGWYSDEEYTNPWTFELPVEADMTLYAKWAEG